MTQNPDDDEQRGRMELALREASYDVHAAWMQKAEHYLDQANEILADLVNGRVPEEEIAGAYRLADTLSGLVSAIGTHTEVTYMLEQEQSNLQHARAHIDHDDEQRAQKQTAVQVMQEAMENAAAEMRRSGVNAEATPHGIVIHPGSPDDA